MSLGKTWNRVLDFFRIKTPDFFKANFEITSTKRSKIIGSVICLVTLIAVILDVNAYISQDFSSKWLLLAFALFCPFILGICAAFSVTIKNGTFNKVWHMIFMLLMPFVTITMTECLNDVFIYDMTYLGFLGNYLLVIIMYFVVFYALRQLQAFLPYCQSDTFRSCRGSQLYNGFSRHAFPANGFFEYRHSCRSCQHI